MLKRKRKVARGLRGNVIAPYDLPPAQGARWTPMRKVDLIAAILGGVITLDEAKARYVRIPRQSGQGFRFDPGHHSEMKPAT